MPGWIAQADCAESARQSSFTENWPTGLARWLLMCGVVYSIEEVSDVRFLRDSTDLDFAVLLFDRGTGKWLRAYLGWSIY